MPGRLCCCRNAVEEWVDAPCRCWAATAADPPRASPAFSPQGGFSVDLRRDLCFPFTSFSMEVEAPKTTRPPSTGAGFFHRFTKLCKLRSVGISPGGIPGAGLYKEDCSTDDTEWSEEIRDRKIHPQPCEDAAAAAVTGEPPNLVIPKLFDLVSSLKAAYILLQQAHIPYDPDKLRSADLLIVSKLESLSELEQSYLGARHRKPNSVSGLEAEIEEQQRLLEKLQTQAQKKDTEILQLRWKLEEVDLKNAEMEEEIKLKSALHEEIVPLHQHLNPSTFSLVFEAAAKSIHDFGKPLIALMKASGWDLDRAADAVAGPVAYAERSHKKYAFEAYLSWKMFVSEELEADCLKKGSVDGVLRFEDPFDALVEDQDSSFARFCRAKYMAVVHPKMEESFFGNLDQRAFVASGGHPRMPLYRAFAKMARWVWVLRVMATAMAPKAEAFYVPRGSGYSEEHMESVVEGEAAKLWRVGLTVVPGFRVGGSVAKCKIYPTREKQGHGSTT
ncbi:hypothetical protein Taro_056430 [Colocasia esculenta]|uniref:DUF641 domain-containing protein n=1 Tax=Colocasia esculenta TaxID=4460 RepID=A0A843XVQ8_COLES|nr:hypothetical protein [Colocasia esculenta]